MKYDWKKIIEDQKCSGLTVTQYCHFYCRKHL